MGLSQLGQRRAPWGQQSQQCRAKDGSINLSTRRGFAMMATTSPAAPNMIFCKAERSSQSRRCPATRCRWTSKHLVKAGAPRLPYQQTPDSRQARNTRPLDTHFKATHLPGGCLGDGRGCKEIEGTFSITSVTYRGDTPMALKLNFLQRCDDNTATLRGHLALQVQPDD